MHRSGTSALCAALQACTASFGSHLLDPMAGVNDEGFWEDAEVVALNERLLAQVGSSWFSLAPEPLDVDWSGKEFEPARAQARQLLQRGFGGGPVEALKDPRLCLTLPFWLAICRDIGLQYLVCVITRSPMAVARSLEKRDGFPLGYGLRLLQKYRQAVVGNAPPDTVYATYEGLLADPVAVMQRLAETLPLTVSEEVLDAAVNVDLRHHDEAQGQGLLYEADSGSIDLPALAAQIDAAYPATQVMAALAGTLVDRGQALTRIGEAHAAALATIEERDEQITEFDRRLAEIGDLHSQALQVINDKDAELQHKDAQLQRVLNTPGVGLMIRAILKHERR
jgi:hypothetical protein